MASIWIKKLRLCPQTPHSNDLVSCASYFVPTDEPGIERDATLSCHTVGCCHVCSSNRAAGRCVAGSVKWSGELEFSVKTGWRQLCRQNFTIFLR